MSLVGQTYDERGYSETEGADRHPESWCEWGVASRSCLAFHFVVRLDVYHIVLLEVIYRSGCQCVYVKKVYPIGFLRAVRLFAEHEYVFTLAVGGEVSCHSYSIGEKKVVFVELKTSRRFDFAEHGDACVGKLYGDNGIFDKILRYQFLFDIFSNFKACHACDMQLAEHRKVDVALEIDGV